MASPCGLLAQVKTPGPCSVTAGRGGGTSRSAFSCSIYHVLQLPASFLKVSASLFLGQTTDGKPACQPPCADITSNCPMDKGWMLLPCHFCRLPHCAPTERTGTINIRHACTYGSIKSYIFFSPKVSSSILIMLTAYQITLFKYAVAPVMNAAVGVGPFWR